MDNINLVPFKFKNLKDLLDLHETRGNALNCELTMKNLPKIGYIAYLGKTPIAAGFLRRVEPNYGQLDTFLSNAYFGAQVRHEGLSRIVTQLLEDAKDLELQGVIAFTKDESIFKRATDMGFQVVNQVILTKALVTKTQ